MQTYNVNINEYGSHLCLRCDFGEIAINDLRFQSQYEKVEVLVLISKKNITILIIIKLLTITCIHAQL